MSSIILENDWQLLPVKNKEDWYQTPSKDGGFFPAKLPGPWQRVSGLQGHHGTVVYKTHFKLSLPKNHYATLILDRACYLTRIRLNGRWIGKPQSGYFQKRYIAFEDQVQTENTLHIEVTCNQEKDLTQKRQVLGIFSHWDMLPRSLNPGGLHCLPEVKVHGPVLPVGLRCHVDQWEQTTAHIVGEIDLISVRNTPAWITVNLQPVNCDGVAVQVELPCYLKRGKNTRLFSMHYKDLQKWWPKGLGAANLYQISAKIKPEKGPAEKIEDVVGFRKVEMQDFNLKINDVPLFMRGANMSPVAPYLSEMTDEKINRVLDDAEALNLNLVRVHSHVAPKSLYREADRRGMLLWQDMPLQWLYHPKLMPEIRRQGRRLMHYVFNHPSVVLFCCANEPIYMEDTGKMKIKQTVLTLWNYFGPSHMRDVIARGLWRDLKQKDTNRIYIQSSGELETPIAEGSDTHLYPGWYPAFGPVERFDWFAAKLPRNIRFVSEFGAQSFPNIETSRSMLSDKLDSNTWPQVVSKHFAQIPNLRNWIDFEACETLADLVEVTQAHQARVSRYIIDRLRHHKYKLTGGFTHFLLNEAMVGVTWSLVDAHGHRKNSFDVVSQCLEPANLYVLPGEVRAELGKPFPIEIYGVNDEKNEVCFYWHVQILMMGQEILAEQKDELKLAPDCARVEAGYLKIKPTKEGFMNVVLHLEKHVSGKRVKEWEHCYRIEVCGPSRKHVGKRKPHIL